MLNNKPTFGAGATTATSSTANKPQEEIGAIWNKVASNTSNYMVVRLNKAKLKEILATLPEDQDNISFVAFTNKGQQGDQKRPAFRIFEEKKR